MPCPPHYPARSAIWALHWSASCWATSPAEFWACSGAWTPGEEPFGSSAQAYRKTRRCAGGVVHRGSSGIQPIAHPRRRPGRTGTSVGRTGLEVSIGRDCAPRVGSEPVPNSVEPVPPDAGGHPSLADLLDGGRGSLGQLAPSPGRFRCAHDGLQPANSLQRPSYRRCASSRSSQFVAGARLDSGPGILAARWMTVA